MILEDCTKDCYLQGMITKGMGIRAVVALVAFFAVLSGSVVCAAPELGNLSAKECLARGVSITKTGGDRAVMRDALHLFDRAIALDPKLSEAYMRAGAIRLAVALKSNDRKRLESAIFLFSRCAELEPKQARCLVMLSNAYGHKGDREGARKSAERACALEESSWCKAVRSGKVQSSIEEIYNALSEQNRLKPADLVGIP